MSPWFRLIVNEARGHLLSPALQLLAATLVGLSLLAVNVGIQQLDVEQAQAAHYQAEQTKAAETLLTGQQGGAALRVVRHPPPGAALVRGVERSRPAYWEPAPAGLLEGPFSTSVDQPSELGPLLDFEGVVRVVLGLMSILIGVRAVAGHRHDHTLQALLDLPIRRWHLATAKFLAALTAVAFTLVVLAGSILLLVRVQAAGAVSTELPSILAASLALALAYGAVLVAIGMVIGAAARSVATAGNVGIGVWGLLTLAYPQLVMFGLHVVAPLPLRAVVEGEMQEMHSTRYLNTLELMGTTAGRLVQDRLSSALLADSPAVRSAIEDLWHADSAETRYLLDVIENRAQAAAGRHDRLFAWLAAPNPAMVFARALGAVADTGSHAETRWRAALEDYQRTLVTLHYDDPPRLTLRVPYELAFVRILFDRKRVPKASDLPRFERPVRDLGDRLYDARRDLALLGAFVLVTGILAVVFFPTAES